MAEVLDPENAAFWLPSSFLDDDECKDNRNNDDYLFGSLDSPVSSTETERGGDSNNNDEDLVAELTRHLAHSSIHDSFNEKPWNFSTSPQSTLTGFGPFTTRSGFSSNGSPNGPSPRVPSPPITPPAKNDAAWELLYEAAGQVARLKMNALAAELNHQQQQNNRFNNLQQNRGLLCTPRNVSLQSKPLHHHHHNSLYDYPQYEQVKRQGNGNFYCQHHHNHNQQRRSCQGGPLGLPITAWPPLRPNHHHHHRQAGLESRSVFLSGPGHLPTIKRQSTGTGVFLPRRAGVATQPAPPEPRKRPTGCLLPARMVDALNMEFEEVNNGVNANPRVRFGAGMLSEQEIIMARRNAVMEQQRRNLMRNDDIRLPSDWTY